MKIFLFYTVFYIVLYFVFPRIGTFKYIDESKKLDPIRGLDRHYRYDPKLCRFHWSLIFILYLMTAGWAIIDCLFCISNIPSDRLIIAGGFVTFVVSFIGIPYVILLLSLKYNPKAGVYIYKDKIVCIGRFYSQTIYKKDIESIEFKGILWGFEIKKKNSKKNDYIMVMTKDLSQQISTLCNYLEMQ